jgi:phosphate starvation-inducible PhoH-like protein
LFFWVFPKAIGLFAFIEGQEPLNPRRPRTPTPRRSDAEILEIPVEEGVLQPLLGAGDSHLHYLQRFSDAKITARRDKIVLRGTPQENSRTSETLVEMITLVRRKGSITTGDIDTIVRLSGLRPIEPLLEAEGIKSIILRAGERIIGTRSAGQEAYFQAIQSHDITFSIGPAGTGKTYIAVAAAVAAFLQGTYDRITLVRPVVEAGENLGFLPGDIREKVDPYFRPLYDALMEMIPIERLKKFLDRSIIEVAPLAYMRGRTLNHTFVILDEAQNTTGAQMKMFLTRMGNHSKAVVTGDVTQIDLPDRRQCGLMLIQDILKGIEGVKFVYLDDRDVVRHQLVKDIIRAYDEYLTKQAAEKEQEQGKS